MSAADKYPIPTVQQIEEAVGMGAAGWDMIDPNSIIDAVIRLAAPTHGADARPVAEWQQRYVGDPRQKGPWERLRNIDWAERVYAEHADHAENGWQVRPLYADDGVSMRPVADKPTADTPYVEVDGVMYLSRWHENKSSYVVSTETASVKAAQIMVAARNAQMFQDIRSVVATCADLKAKAPYRHIEAQRLLPLLDVFLGEGYTGRVVEFKRILATRDAAPSDDAGGLIGPDTWVEHEMVLQPSSSIWLCRFCGLSKVAIGTNELCDVGSRIAASAPREKT